MVGRLAGWSYDCNFVDVSASGGCPLSGCPVGAPDDVCTHTDPGKKIIKKKMEKKRKITHALAVELAIGDCGLGTAVALQLELQLGLRFELHSCSQAIFRPRAVNGFL